MHMCVRGTRDLDVRGKCKVITDIACVDHFSEVEIAYMDHFSVF